MDPTGHITPYHYITRIDIHFNGFDSGFLSRPAFHLRPMMCLATQWSERPTMWRLTRRGELVEVHGWGVCMWEFVHLTGHQNDKKLLNMAIYSWFMLIFPLIAWWFSIGFLYVYQRVTCINHQHPTSNIQQHPATSSNPWVAVWSSWFFSLFARDFEKCRA